MADAKRSARAVRAAARAAERNAKAEAWRAVVDVHFGYLRTGYGFRVTQVDASSFWETRVVYETATTAVYVDESVEFDRVEVSLIRLVNGAIPTYPIFVTPETAMHEFLLDDLLAVRAPHLLPQLQAMAGLGDDQIQACLVTLARALDAYAADILQGDFTIFATLEERVKQYLSEHPQEITVWVSEETPPERVARLVEETRQSAPSQPVVVRTYRRGRATRRKRTADGAGSSC